MKIRHKVLLATTFLIFSSWIGGPTGTLAQAEEMAAPTAYAKLDQLFAEGKLDEAQKEISALLSANADDKEALWRKARLLVIEGNATEDKEAKIKKFEEAKKMMSDLIDKDDSYMPAYLRRAVATGRLALYQGILKTRGHILSTRSDAKKALELNNSTAYDLALAHYLLGRLHYNLAQKPKALRMPLGLSWGNYKDAGKHLKMAAEGAPTSAPFNYDYAVYLNYKDKKDEAKAFLKKALDAPITDPSDKETKEKAKALLAEL